MGGGAGINPAHPGQAWRVLVAQENPQGCRRLQLKTVRLAGPEMMAAEQVQAGAVCCPLRAPVVLARGPLLSSCTLRPTWVVVEEHHPFPLGTYQERSDPGPQFWRGCGRQVLRGHKAAAGGGGRRKGKMRLWVPVGARDGAGCSKRANLGLDAASVGSLPWWRREKRSEHR